MALETDDPADKPSTSSLASLADKISPRVEKFKAEVVAEWHRTLQKLPKKLREANGLFSGKDQQGEAKRGREWLVPILGEERAARMKAGWERVKDIYWREYSMERDIIKTAAWTGFIAGYFVGGMSSIPESIRRYELFTAGKMYKSITTYRTRHIDYAMLRFTNRGVVEGIQLGLVNIFVVMLAFGATAFRDYYSVLHFPLATAPVAIFAGNTTWRGWGLTGVHAATAVSLVPNGFLLLATVGCCAYYRCWPNEGYWRLKEQWEREVREEEEGKRELDAYQKERKPNAIFRRTRWLKKEMEKERELGTWRYVKEGELEMMLKEGGEAEGQKGGEHRDGDDI